MRNVKVNVHYICPTFTLALCHSFGDKNLRVHIHYEHLIERYVKGLSRVW